MLLMTPLECWDSVPAVFQIVPRAFTKKVVCSPALETVLNVLHVAKVGIEQGAQT